MGVAVARGGGVFVWEWRAEDTRAPGPAGPGERMIRRWRPAKSCGRAGGPRQAAIQRFIRVGALVVGVRSQQSVAVAGRQGGNHVVCPCLSRFPSARSPNTALLSC